MNKKWKPIVSSALCAIMLTTTALLAPAPIVGEVLEGNPAVMTSQEGIMPYAEETTWCFRIHNGMLQKRLWSNTRGIWLTEWTDCGVAP